MDVLASLALVGKGLYESLPVSEVVKSVPHLINEKRAEADLNCFRTVARALPATSCSTLVVRLQTTTDPLLLWAMHCELDKRSIPPCLRWPMNDASEQAEYLTWLADLLWFCKRHPGHKPTFRGWQGLFKNPPACTSWHQTAHRQFIFVGARYSLAHWCAKGIGLKEAQRQELMMLPTTEMQAERRQLRSDRFAATRARLLSAAISKPDKAAKHCPHAVADRRAVLWRVYLLSGRSQTATAKHWKLLTGNELTRQAIAKQLGIIRDSLD
jgi:hypothetical protein